MQMSRFNLLTATNGHKLLHWNKPCTTKEDSFLACDVAGTPSYSASHRSPSWWISSLCRLAGPSGWPVGPSSLFPGPLCTLHSSARNGATKWLGVTSRSCPWAQFVSKVQVLVFCTSITYIFCTWIFRYVVTMSLLCRYVEVINKRYG
jgi:hypothetical protein